jgi:sugar phosphate isomerase/epimerase
MTPIALQMWTVRRETDRSVPETLARIKESGYDAVETAGLYGLTPSQMREGLAGAGLQVSSAHTPLPDADQADEAFGQLAELGATVAFCASIREEHFADDLTVGRAADRFNAVLDAAARNGIEFGYHNHWWEFSNHIDGRPAYERFVQRLDPRALLEVDTYWAEVGGVRAAELLSSLGRRAAYLHVKDGPVDLKSPQRALGEGKLDIGQILAAAPDARWHIVELDDYDGNIWEAVARSADYLAAMGR